MMSNERIDTFGLNNQTEDISYFARDISTFGIHTGSNNEADTSVEA